MSSVSSTTTTQASNKLRSTAVYGQFGNFDKSDGSIPAYGVFQRNLLVNGNLILGSETIDSSGNAIDTSSNILFTLNKTAYSIPLKTLSYIQNVSSDIQTQINNISTSGGASTHPLSLTVGGQYQNNSGDFSAFTNSFFVAPTASFNSGLNANSVSSFYDISFNRYINGISKTVLGYLSNVSSDIQTQINTVSTNLTNIGNSPLVLYSTLNVSGLATLTQVQINTSLSVLQNVSFVGTLNNISATTFSYLSNLTSNIQNQINNISNTTPVGSVIMFSGTGQSLNGYLPCNGQQYPIPSYTALFNVIRYTYGGNEATGFFNVPNFQGVFLRGAGNQTLDLQVPSSPKNYISPGLGLFVKDKSVQPSNYVNGITQSVKSFLERANSDIVGVSFTTSNAVANLQYSTASDTGVVETFPIHTSIQYFIKY
jgi:hypothetical protein